MSWSKRLNLAVGYIEDNLNGSLALEDVARIACCSKYHFHRVFFASFGVTFAEYVRRRRFTLAAVDILSGDRKIVDIALKYGYDSANAFTRAFRHIHEVNPSQARTSDVSLTSYNRVFFPLEITAVEKMEYKIVKKPSFKIIGKSKVFEFDEFVKNGSKFWKKYVTSTEYKKLCQLTNGKPGH
jgi:AraC family transcriptional regulator